LFFCQFSFVQVEKKRIRVSFGANEVRSMSPGTAHSISPPPPSLGGVDIVSGSAHSRLGQPAAVKMVPTFKKVAVGAGKFEMRKILMPASKTTASSTSSPLGGQCCHLPSPVKRFFG
jgi:hypothetical protein